MHSLLAEKLFEALPVLPRDGIAYRGDAIRYSAGSLQRSSGNYIIFTPGESPETLATELQEGINFALQFSYPRDWGENPKDSIPGEFQGYSAHYRNDQLSLPAISWGVSSFDRQLAIAKNRGSVLYTSGGCIAIGKVQRDGPITERANSSPVVATLDDIRHIEETVGTLQNERSRVRSFATWKSKKARANEYLAGSGRPIFHERLGSIIALRLVEVLTKEFCA